MYHPHAQRLKQLRENLDKLDPSSLEAVEQLIDLLPQAPAPQDELKQELLSHYAARDPQSFFQFDAFTDVIEDCVMRPDPEGDCVMSGVTQELMTGVYAARVLITPGTSPEKAGALLHKIAHYITEDGFTFYQAELERVTTARKTRHQILADDVDEPF